jgi:hypothetical protein
MKSTSGIGFLMACLVAGLGCSTAPSEEPSNVPARAAIRTAETLSAAMIPGFAQSMSTSKFQTGGAVTTSVSVGMTRWVGSNGVFAVDSANGSASGVMNGGVPFTPYAGGRVAHEALVRAYFLGAGLPADQVGQVRTNTNARGDGVPGSPEVPTKFSYSSIVTRSVSGILVGESHAWARLDVNGNVVAEGVYWPALDASAVSDAVLISQTISGSGGAAYFAILPVAPALSGTGSVVIHHSSAFVETTAFQDFGCYDVWIATEGGSGYMRHFDKNGLEVRLPQELR